MLGLCICYYNHNYGSMLQAYATVREIEKRGIPYEIIQYKKKVDAPFLLKMSCRLFNKIWVSEKKLSIQKKFSQCIYPEYKKNAAVRDKVFDDFSKNTFIKLSDVCYGYDALQEYSKKFSSVLVGSDQMWSPSGLTTNFYNLMFADDSVNKISYAASFGVSEIPYYQKKKTAEYLERIEHISVRENAGKKIVETLTDKNAFVAVDPTMLLSRDEWDEFSEEQRKIDGDYIFAYFLGDNAEHRQRVEQLKTETGLKVVSLRHLDEYISADENFGDISPYDVGPREFLNILKNAKYVCTDSFHGTVFSIIFQRQFLTFNRYSNSNSSSKNSRIDTLLSNLNLSERRYSDEHIFEQINETIDFESVENRRCEFVKASKEFLTKALKMEEVV